MKQQYFTSSTINEKSMLMLEKTREFVHRRPVLSAFENSALLVLDMQRYFLEGSSHAFVPSAVAIIENVNNLIRAFYQQKIPVFLSQHFNTPLNARLMKSWWKETLRANHPLSGIDPRIEKQKGITFIKFQYDAFLESPLDELLREKNIRRLFICGVMTHLCCETTARSAFMRGYEVFFTVDATATYNEAFHQASLLNLAHGFATLILVQDILSNIRLINE